MSDLGQLLIGLTLLILSLGIVIFLRPQRGKSVSAFVKKPLVGPLLASLVTVGFGVGLILLASYFTTIDNVKLSG